MALTIIDDMRARLAQAQLTQAALATLGDDGQPQVRPVTMMNYERGFYFATSRSSRKTAQIVRDRRVEFVAVFREGSSNGYLRVEGLAQEIRDLSLMQRVTTASAYPVREYWRGIDDPDFFFFEVRPSRVEYLKPGDAGAVEITGEFNQ